jgi:hypothetical protein
MLGMGLREISGKAGLVMQRRRSPAKPDGLGGVVSILSGEDGIFSGGGLICGGIGVA